MSHLQAFNLMTTLCGHQSTHGHTVVWGLLCLVFLITVATYLLLRSGDVETNPGPSLNGMCCPDLRTVCEELAKVKRKWRNIGLMLNVPHHKLKEFEKGSNPLIEVINDWLNGNVKDVPVTWRSIVAALESDSVGERGLAKIIMNKYCQSEYQKVDLPQPATVKASPSSSQLDTSCDPNNQVKDELKTSLKATVPNGGGPTPVYTPDNPPIINFSTLSDRFQGIGVSLLKELQQNEVKLTDVRNYISFLPQPLLQEYYRSTEESFDKLEKLKTLTGLFHFLNAQVWNFIDYHLLEYVILKFGSKELKQSIKQYAVDLKEYNNSATVYEFMQFWPTRQKPPNYDDITVKLDKDPKLYTMRELDELRQSLSVEFWPRLSDYAKFVMYHYSQAEGCFKVTWILPPGLVSEFEAVARSPRGQAFFVQNQVLSVVIRVSESEGGSNPREVYAIHTPVNPLKADIEHLRDTLEKTNVPQTISDTTVIKQYSAYLKDLYSHNPNKTFKLAAIERKKVERRKLDKFTRSTLRGNHDDVVYSKHHMEEDEVGCPTHWTSRSKPRLEPRLILIEGAPGVGKTTFSQQFCYKWSQGQCMSKNKLLVLLPLRDEGVRSGKNVSDLFPHPQLQQAIAEEVEGSDGEGVALWLEGWDELNEELRKDSSIFLDLLHGDVLPKATIIITGRPWATKNIRESASVKVDQHIEIFTTPDTELQRVLKERIKPDSRAKFLDYLEHNLMVKAAMHTPVTANIVADVFQWCGDTESPLPTTTTELYTALICMLLTQHTHSKPIQSLNEVPEDVKNLCRLAWQGLVEQQRLTFSSDDVGGDTLGLMHEMKELYGGKDGQLSYHFIHLTLQEFLSAYHITQLPPDKQEQIIREHIDTGHLTMTVRFFFGLTKPNILTSSLISHHIFSQRENQHMSVFYWLFESRSCISLESDKEVEVRSSYSWTSLDYFVLGDAISRHHFQWKLRLCLAGLGQEELSSLFNGMATSSSRDNTAILSSPKGSIKFDLSSNHISGSLQNLSKCPPDTLHRIMALQLGTNHLNRDDLNALSKAIPKLTSLQDLSMPGNSIGDGGAVEILKSLRKIALEELDLRGTGVGEQDTPFLIELLSNGHLKELSIDGILLPSITSVIMKNPLPDSMLQLDTLDMSYSYISNETALSMVPLLMNSKLRLSKLNIGMECGISSEIAKLIASALAQNNWLKSLKVSYNTNIGDTGAGAISQMLRPNATLEELEIEDCGITSDGAVELAEALSINSTLKILDMSMNEIGEEGAKAISRMLEKNVTLETLYLHGDRSLEREGASELISSLAKNTTLQCLTLSRSYQRDVPDARVKWKGR